MTVEELAKKLDDMGWVLVNLEDPVTGDPTPALDWEQVKGVLGDFEESIEQYKIDIERLQERNLSLREQNLRQGEGLGKIWWTMFGNVQPGTSSYDELTESILQGLESKMPSIEVTDTLVNDLALAAFGPSVVYDRERLRAAVAQVLQTR